MRRCFLWLAGTDQDILARCSHTGRSETARFTGIGALVLVPATLGLFSMSYAMSTVSESTLVALAAGAAWAMIILAVDRFVISTTYASIRSSVWRRAASAIVRLLLASVIGVAVAHPFVLLWFDDSVVAVIDGNRRAAVDDRIRQAELAKQAITAAVPPVRSGVAAAARDQRTELKDCLTRLQLLYEQSDRRSVELPCGVTSGRASCGARCQQIGERIDQVLREIDELNRQIGEAQAVERDNIDKRDRARAAVDERAGSDVAAITARFSYDYLARVDGLDQLAEDNAHITAVSWFVILLFVLVDVLPVLMKLMAPRGEYEEIRDTLLMERSALEDARRRIIGSGVYASALAQTQAAGDQVLADAALISRVALAVPHSYDEHRTAFEARVRGIRDRFSDDPEFATTVEPHLVSMREIDNQAWATVFARVIEYLKRC